MAGEALFEGLAAQMAPQNNAMYAGRRGCARPSAIRFELRAVDIDSLIGQDHPVRVIWGYVEGLDLSLLEDRIRGREAHSGPSPDCAAASVGVVALRHQRGRWQRAGAGAAVREPRRVSLAVRRGVGELSHAGGLPGRLRRSA